MTTIKMTNVDKTMTATTIMQWWCGHDGKE